MGGFLNAYCDLKKRGVTDFPLSVLLPFEAFSGQECISRAWNPDVVIFCLHKGHREPAYANTVFGSLSLVFFFSNPVHFKSDCSKVWEGVMLKMSNLPHCFQHLENKAQGSRKSKSGPWRWQVHFLCYEARNKCYQKKKDSHVHYYSSKLYLHSANWTAPD